MNINKPRDEYKPEQFRDVEVICPSCQIISTVTASCREWPVCENCQEPMVRREKQPC